MRRVLVVTAFFMIRAFATLGDVPGQPTPPSPAHRHLHEEQPVPLQQQHVPKEPQPTTPPLSAPRREEAADGANRRHLHEESRKHHNKHHHHHHDHHHRPDEPVTPPQPVTPPPQPPTPTVPSRDPVDIAFDSLADEVRNLELRSKGVLDMGDVVDLVTSDDTSATPAADAVPSKRSPVDAWIAQTSGSDLANPGVSVVDVLNHAEGDFSGLSAHMLPLHSAEPGSVASLLEHVDALSSFDSAPHLRG